MSLAEVMESLGKESRPAKIQRYRKKYGDYKIGLETEGEQAKSFNEWLVEQGVDPTKLLFE